MEEKVLLEFVKANPKATQEQIAKHIGKSSRTVKRITASLYAKGYLKRENAKRNVVWITIEYRLRLTKCCSNIIVMSRIAKPLSTSLKGVF